MKIIHFFINIYSLKLILIHNVMRWHNCLVKSSAVYKPTLNSYLVKLLCLPRHRKKNQASGQGKAISNAINQKKIILCSQRRSTCWYILISWLRLRPRLTGRHNGIPGSHPHPQVAILLQVTILYTELIKATDVPSNKIAARHKK